jgi:TolA-binding protein
MKSLARIIVTRSVMYTLAAVFAAIFANLGGPLLAQDTDAATREYKAAVALQNSEVYDVAAKQWGKFIDGTPGDSRVNRARQYQGVCYFRTAVAAADAKQTAAARKAFDAAEADFAAVANVPRFDLLEETYLFRGLAQFKRAEIEQGEQAAECYRLAAESLDALAKNYPQSKYLAQALYYRGDCAEHAGQAAEAARFYSQALAKSPDDKLEPEIMYALGLTQEGLKQWDEAGKTYDAYLKKYANHRYASEVIMRRGETLFAQKLYEPAAEWLAAAAARRGFESADYATMRQAVALAKLGKQAEAGDLLAAIFTKFPRSTRFPVVLKTGHALARGLVRDNHPSEAIAMVEKLLPHAQGQEEMPQLLMDRADAAAALGNQGDGARRADSVGFYAELANKYPKSAVAPQALYLAAYGALTQGDYTAALQYTDSFLSTYPKQELVPDVRFVAAESRLLLGKYAEAENLYAELLEKYPQHADADSWRVRQGTAQQLQKKYAEVVALLQPVAAQIKNPETRAEANFLVGTSLVELKRYGPAIPVLQAALAAAPKWRQADETLLHLGQCCFIQGERAEACAAIERLIREFPLSKILDRAHFRLGEYAAAANDRKRAAAEYRLVIDKWPESPLVPNALHGLGWAMFDQNSFAEAEEAFNTLVEKYPKNNLNVRGHYARGLARHQLGKFADAADDLQAVLAAGGVGQGAVGKADCSDARYVLGLCQVGLKQPGDAAATFQALLKDDPKYAALDKVYYELAWALKQAGHDKEAVGAFADLIKKCPDSPRVGESQFHVGEAAYKDGKFRDAAVAYAVALDKSGKSDLGEKSVHKLGWTYYRLDDMPRAQQAFANQRATWPNGPLSADAAFMEAECLFKQMKYGEALAAYQRVKDPSSKDFQVLTLLHGAQSLAAQAIAMNRGDQEEPRRRAWQDGVARLDRLLKKFPDTTYLAEALYERGWALQNLGRTDEAAREYQQVLEKSKAEPAARALFMIGEIEFQKKQYDEAVQHFYQVLYGYAYPQWQADAAFEAAKCFEARHNRAQAIKLYHTLIDRFPQSDKLAAAKSRIEALQKE